MCKARYWKSHNQHYFNKIFAIFVQILGERSKITKKLFNNRIGQLVYGYSTTSPPVPEEVYIKKNG